MSRAIIKTAKSGEDIRYTEDVNLSFSSEIETPKIFLQTSSNYDLAELGYIPSFMGFRNLSSSIITRVTNADYISSGFDSDDYTFSISSTMDSVGWDGVTIADAIAGYILYVGGFSGYFFGHDWADTGGHAILFFDPCTTETPVDLSLEKTSAIILASEGYDVSAHPTNLNVDSRFDTFRIYKTGTLELSLSAETVTAGNTSSSTESYAHNLGYPPVYLPEAGVDWNISNIYGTITTPFIVNDNLGQRDYRSNPTGNILDVWVDSTNLNMRVVRTEGDYPALTVKMYYTIFYNDITEEFNLLT